MWASALAALLCGSALTATALAGAAKDPSGSDARGAPTELASTASATASATAATT